MSQLDLYWDLTGGRLVRSTSDSNSYTLPTFQQEDNPAISLRAMKRVNYVAAPIYEQVALSGYSLRISVGTANNSLASQSTWTLDTTGYVLSASLDLSTSGINALADGSEQLLEIELSDATSKYRITPPVTIKKSVVLGGSVTPVTIGTALSEQKAAIVYVPKKGCRAIQWEDADGNEYLEYMHTDGSKRIEKLT